MKKAVLSLSGGMDSSTLLLHLLANDYEVIALGFDYGQKHRIELKQATKLVKYLQKKGFDVTYQIIELKGLSNLLVSGLINNNSMELIRGHYAHENAKSSYVPNRNSILSAIAYSVALSRVAKTGESCPIALATHMGDFDNQKQEGIYPDCSQEFKEAIEHAFKIGNWDSDKVDYYAPYNVTDKTGVLKDGLESCKALGLNYKQIYKRTNTSYAPIKVGNKWFSDFRTGSSVERIESFIKLGKKDPLQYAEDNGELVTWDFVKKHVEEVCKEWSENQI